MASNMLSTCPLTSFRKSITDAQKQLDRANGLLKDHFSAAAGTKRKSRGVARLVRATAPPVAVVIGSVLAVKGAIWVANGTIDNVVAIKGSATALYKRIFGDRTTDTVRAAMETLSAAVVLSEDEERENQEEVDALAGDGPAGVGGGADDEREPARGGLGGGGEGADEPAEGADPARPGRDDAADGAARAGAGGRRRRGRGTIVAQFEVGGRTYKLDGEWARLAFEAKERFRGVGYATYNQAALSRWLNAQVEKKKNLRWTDRRANLGIIELFVWYIDDAEKALNDSFAHLKASGRIRGGLD